MKIYIATKTDNYKQAQRIRDLLLDAGHEITFDWTEVVAEVGPDKGLRSDTPPDREFQRICAQNDMQGVREADALVMLCYPGLCGTLIEVGAALVLGTPVIILGEPERNSVFFAMQHVHRIEEGALIVPEIERIMTPYLNAAEELLEDETRQS